MDVQFERIRGVNLMRMHIKDTHKPDTDSIEEGVYIKNKRLGII